MMPEVLMTFSLVVPLLPVLRGAFTSDPFSLHILILPHI